MKRKLIALLIISLLMFTFGCESYVELDTSYESVVGTWHLNCIYVNAHPIEFKDETITFNADNSGTITVLQTDENGVTGEVSSAISVSSGTNSNGEATVTINKGDGNVEYTYKVDNPAQLLHLYTTDAETGDEYHYIYENDMIEF